jgi:HK97 gp10 family phage protein
MAGEIKVRFENEAEVLKAIEAMGLKPRTVLRQAVQAGAEVVERAAEGKAPGPGIGTEPAGQAADSVTVAVGPLAEKWYYKFFETGTGAHEVRPVEAEALRIGDEYAARAAAGGMAARPFLRPALDENEQAAAAAAGVVFRGVLG